MRFIKIFVFAISVIIWIFEVVDGKLNKDKEKEYAYISFVITAVGFIHLFADIFTDEMIYSILLWIQGHLWIAGLYILCIALLPSVIAQRECTQKKFWAEKDYAAQNRKYNFRGAVASCAAFGLVYSVVGDFAYLKFFHMEELVPPIAIVNVWMCIFYQKIECKKEKAGKADHSTSLEHMNQKLNLLHLFNVYFLASVSVMYLVSYTIYCSMYHISIEVNSVTYYILITVALWFFYSLSQHKHQYLYVIFIIFIPVILISSVYWMSWFTLSQEMRLWQWVFIFFHSMLYIICIYKREKVICISRNNDKKEQKGIKIGKWEIISENWFLLILPVVVMIIYIIVWKLPVFIDRLPANEAYNYIDMICEGTDVDPDVVIGMAEEQEMYNEKDGTYDIEAFMRFISKELGDQMLDKGIINEKESIPTQDVLGMRLKNMPRKQNQNE